MNSISALIDKCISEAGEVKTAEALQQLLASVENPTETLTIISNQGLHHVPTELLRGEVFYASTGTLDFSSGDAVKSEVIAIVQKLFELNQASLAS